MKTSIVLFVDTPALNRLAAEINLLLSGTAALLKTVELWLFYHDNKPEVFPDMDCSLSSVRLIRVEHPHLPESFLSLLEQMANDHLPDLLFFASDGLGAELATRLSYRLKGSSCLMVETLKINSGHIEVTKSAYGHYMVAEYTMNGFPYCLSAANTPCQPAEHMEKEPPVLQLEEISSMKPDWVKSVTIVPEIIDAELENAEIILAVGSGVKNKNNMENLESVAKSLGAQMGASRPVVMNAWTDMNRLIGISGKIVSPSLCLAVGVSGTGAFYAGIKNSELIVAVNTDRDADIFQQADIGIVDDLMVVLMELEDVINSQKQ